MWPLSRGERFEGPDASASDQAANDDTTADQPSVEPSTATEGDTATEEVTGWRRGPCVPHRWFGPSRR